MINYYKEITGYQGEDVFHLLARIDLDMLFEPIREEFEEVDLCNQAVKFIVYLYSIDSDRITIGGDRRREKASVFAELGIDKEYYSDFMSLENEVLVDVILSWVRRQDNRHFEYLMTLREVYVQQQSAALRPLKKASGDVDYDQKQKCVEHMTALRKMIKDAEAELIQNDPKMKEVVEEIKKVSKKALTTGPEHYAS